MRILYATDGSGPALEAARLLAELPLEAECTLTVLAVDDRHVSPEAALDSAAAMLRHSTAGIDTRVRRGHAADEILREAEEHPTDLVVVGARGHSALARFFVGSVAERVARHAHCPVLVVRPGAGAPRRVLVGVDASGSAARAVEWLAGFPLPADAEIRLATLLPNLHGIAQEQLLLFPPYVEERTTLADWQRRQARTRMDELAGTLAAAGRRPVCEVREGDAAPGLLALAEEEGADLLVVGSRGLSPAEQFLLGSVSESVVRHSRASVLVVR